jgi:hypothetical protein
VRKKAILRRLDGELRVRFQYGMMIKNRLCIAVLIQRKLVGLEADGRRE